jgi:hypothetical protein
MTVAELIEKLKGMPPDAKVYYASSVSFAAEDAHLPLEQRREECLVYDVDVEHKTVLALSDYGPSHPYTGAMFQIG